MHERALFAMVTVSVAAACTATDNSVEIDAGATASEPVTDSVAWPS